MKQSVIILGDNVQVLQTFEPESFDSMVTDPPAAISFMSASWDTHTLDGFEDMLTAVFTEAYRVLKPGAHILVWSLPRTSYRTGKAIERAGFAMWDAIHNFKDRSSEVQAFLASLTPDQVELLVRAEPTDNMIGFCFGRGFPKSLNVSKAIDKLKGAKREVLGTYDTRGIYDGTPRKSSKHPWTCDADEKQRDVRKDFTATTITAPATSEAKQWEGFGSALKPAIEIWWLARKPLREKTVAEQVLSTGTGALNIDACRIGYQSEADQQNALPGSMPKAHDMSGAFAFRNRTSEKPEDFQNSKGRWPANITLQHSENCRKVGSKKVPGHKGYPNGPGGLYKQGYQQSSEIAHDWNKFSIKADNQPWLGHADAEGNETVDAYECVEGCPVKALDEQSGASKSPLTYIRQTDSGNQNAYGKGMGEIAGKESLNYGDSGGASRFYQNFEPDPNAPPFFYGGKISTGERKADLEEDKLINRHPTTKTLKLMTYLVKLITPPKGLVLDPFAGSGSTIVAAVSNGFSGVGIEREADYHRIASKRVQTALERAQSDQDSQDMFDMAMGNTDGDQ